MDDYNLTDALHAVIAQISQPEFLLTLAITVAVLALLVVFTPRRPMTGSDIATSPPVTSYGCQYVPVSGRLKGSI